MSRLSRRASRVFELVKKFVHHPGFRESPVLAIFRLMDWWVRCRLGRPGVFPWPGHEPLRIALPPVWVSSYIDSYVFRTVQQPERELDWLAGHLTSGSVFIDVGANLGQWTMPLAQVVGPSGQVLAVEPASATALALRTALAVNRLTMVKVIPVALSDREGVAFLHHHDRDPSQHSLGAVGGVSEAIRTRTLDALLAERPVSRVDAMKIDVEGAEEKVLRGASDVLARLRPIVVFEVFRGLPDRLGLEVDGAWRLLLEAGYRTFRISDTGDLRPAVPEELDQQAGGWNVIAVPLERAADLW